MSDRAAARRSDFVGSQALLKRCFALAKLEYYDAPIIESSEKLNGKEGYRVHEINTGYIYMLIVPKYY